MAIVVAFVVGLLLLVIAALVKLTVAVATAVVAHIWELAIAPGCVALAVATFAALRVLASRRVNEYLGLCRTLSETGSLEAEKANRLRALAAKVAPTSPSRVAGEEHVYRDLVSRVIADGIVDEHEREVLQELEHLFTYDPALSESIKEQAFLGLLTALQGDLSEHAEQLARHNAAALGLSSATVQAHLQPLIDHRERVRSKQRAIERAAAEQLREQERHQAEVAEDHERASRVLELEQRPPVSTTLKLQKSEVPYYAVPATELKRLRKGDKRRQGQLIVTNRRVIHHGDGSVSVRLAKVVDAAADTDHGLVQIVKDGRRTPYLFEVRRPQETLAHLLRSLEEAEAAR